MRGAGSAGKEHSDMYAESIRKVQVEAVGKVQIIFAGYNSKAVT
jgi:hypothetical protein